MPCMCECVSDALICLYVCVYSIFCVCACVCSMSVCHRSELCMLIVCLRTQMANFSHLLSILIMLYALYTRGIALNGSLRFTSFGRFTGFSFALLMLLLILCIIIIIILNVCSETLRTSLGDEHKHSVDNGATVKIASKSEKENKGHNNSKNN